MGKPHESVVAGIILREGKILIAQRPLGVHCSGLWEFPGGKIKPAEDPLLALQREIEEELGIEVAPGPLFHQLTFDYPEKRVDLAFYLCTFISGEPKPLSSQKIFWSSPAELDQLSFPPANKQVVEKIKAVSSEFSGSPL